MRLHKNLRKIALQIRYRWLDWVLSFRTKNKLFTVPLIEGDIRPHGTSRPILFAACDSGYFRKYGHAFIGSMATHAPGYPLRLHVYNPTEDDRVVLGNLTGRSDALDFSWTCENVDLSRLNQELRGIYYYSMRFVRMAEHMKGAGTCCFCLDVDALAVQDLATTLESLVQLDIAFFSRFEKFGGNTKLLAGTLFVNCNERATPFMESVASQIQRFIGHGKLLEKFDQQVIYDKFKETSGAFPDLKFEHLGMPVIDTNFTDGGIIWYPKGQSKNVSRYMGMQEKYELFFKELIRD